MIKHLLIKIKTIFNNYFIIKKNHNPIVCFQKKHTLTSQYSILVLNKKTKTDKERKKEKTLDLSTNPIHLKIYLSPDQISLNFITISGNKESG